MPLPTRSHLAANLAASALAALVLAPAAGAAAQEYIGRSLRGRPIVAYQRGHGDGRRILVFGAIHGNETAGIAIAQRLLENPPATGSEIWVVPDLNPDGTALRRRQNGDGIDLNRNFPFRWQPVGSGGAFDYPGPRPASEPETQFAMRLIRTLHPAITIWFHQALDVVDLSGGSAAIERRFGQLVGLPVQRLERYPGSGSRWSNHRFPGTTSFVVELPAGTLSQAAVTRYVRAIVTISR